MSLALGARKHLATINRTRSRVYGKSLPSGAIGVTSHRHLFRIADGTRLLQPQASMTRDCSSALQSPWAAVATKLRKGLRAAQETNPRQWYTALERLRELEAAPGSGGGCHICPSGLIPHRSYLVISVKHGGCPPRDDWEATCSTKATPCLGSGPKTGPSRKIRRRQSLYLKFMSSNLEGLNSGHAMPPELSFMFFAKLVK